MRTRRVVRPVTAAVVAALVLAGCSAGTDSASAPPAAPASTTAPPAATPAPAGTVIEVRYAGGEVTGVEQRVPVPLGETVVLRVTSDVAEEVHVHGYDVVFDLAPGGTVERTFTADQPGSWEVELHDAGRPLFQMRVS